MKLLQLPTPHLIVMVGIVGSGKSFFAEKFAHTFQAPLISDTTFVDILTDAKVTTDHAGQLLKDLLSHQLDELLKTERTIVMDIDSDNRTDRTALVARAKKHGYETLFIWTQTDLVTAKERAVKPSKKSSNKKISVEQFDRQLKHFTPPNTTENTVVISGKHTYATQARVVLKRLSCPRAELIKKQLTPVRPAATSASSRHNITIR